MHARWQGSVLCATSWIAMFTIACHKTEYIVLMVSVLTPYGERTSAGDYQLINERRVVIIVRYIKYASTLNFDL